MDAMLGFLPGNNFQMCLKINKFGREKVRIIRINIVLLKAGEGGGGEIQAISKRTDYWPPLCELVKESECKNKTRLYSNEY